MSKDKRFDLQRDLFKPLEIATWAFIVFGAVATWLFPVITPSQQPRILILLLLAASYVWLFFHVLLPRYHARPWIKYVPMIVNLTFASVVQYLLGAVLNIELIYAAIIVSVGIRLGRSVALVAAVLSTIASILIGYLRSESWLVFLLPRIFDLVVYLLVGYLAATLAETIRRQANELTRHNHALALLVETNTIVATALDFQSMMPRLAEKIATGIPVTLCSVCLVENETGNLIVLGVYPLRPLTGWHKGVGQSLSLEDLKWHRKVVETGQPSVIRQDDSAMAMDEKERAAMFFDGIQSACLVPMTLENRVVGVISVGEARRWEQQSFDQEKVNLVQSIAGQATASINNIQLHGQVQNQLKRLAVLNEVARAIGSTIEMDQLLELIYQQLSRVIATDTYYVVLHEANSDVIDIRVIIDEGVRFPPVQVPYGEGLAGYVLEQRKPLLIRHLSMEMDSLPIKPKIIGQDKISESWLGLPIVVSDHFTGVLVVASYKPNAFDEKDVELLKTIAGQAAIALDNARHHAQVEEQARRDSLTGVYNHGFLLKRLEEEVERARKERQPVSLIMLDIDHFKAYNDSFGHVVGDEVLRLIVQAIQTHVKQTDVVGRWGGEEFGVILPSAATEQARAVAERIRETLMNLPLVGRDSQPIPKPTVSQGIATLPDHAAEASELIDLADRTLYEAKGQGRDQIIVAQTPSQPSPRAYP